MKAICEYCKNEFSFKRNSSTGRFCSVKCSGYFKQKVDTVKRFEEGKLHERKTIKKVLLSIKDSCWNCGINKWDSKPLVLEVDHMNGDPSNDYPNNLQLLCPNCHSQTSSFCGRNLGKGRKSKGLSIA